VPCKWKGLHSGVPRKQPAFSVTTSPMPYQTPHSGDGIFPPMHPLQTPCKQIHITCATTMRHGKKRAVQGVQPPNQKTAHCVISIPIPFSPQLSVLESIFPGRTRDVAPLSAKTSIQFFLIMQFINQSKCVQIECYRKSADDPPPRNPRGTQIRGKGRIFLDRNGNKKRG
jgi:hypothetical protein